MIYLSSPLETTIWIYDVHDYAIQCSTYLRSIPHDKKPYPIVRVQCGNGTARETIEAIETLSALAKLYYYSITPEPVNLTFDCIYEQYSIWCEGKHNIVYNQLMCPDRDIENSVEEFVMTILLWDDN